jgi:tetratricopeptide (TPR) repeat protein
MMNGNMKSFVAVIFFLAVFFFNISTLLAVAFPFREFDEGGPVPEVKLQGLKDAGKTVSFAGLKGKPFLVVFWGADLPEKIDHSARALAEVEALSSFLKERNVQTFSVNIQGDEGASIAEVVKQSGSTLEVYSDSGQKAYAALGLFVLPTVLLVDKDGRAAAGLGFSRDLGDRLRGAVEIMLGEKTVAQVEAELRPEMKEASDQEKGGKRHYDFGLVMMRRGQTDTAIREFSKAVEINPALIDAHLQLGCLYLGKNQLAEAEKAINQALAGDPNSVRGKICRGELKRLKGQLAEAVQELQAVLSAAPDNYEALYFLGRVHEDQKQDQEAMAAYRNAYAAIRIHSVAGKE